MQNNCIKNLLDLKEVIVKNIKNFKNSLQFTANLKRNLVI